MSRIHVRGMALMAGLLLTGIAAEPGAAEDAAAPAYTTAQIEQVVAPVALYPDALLAQVLMASTYPLEIVEAARWSAANPNVTGKALEDAMQQQNWDPSVESLTAFPEVLTMMNEELSWTMKLGDIFLAQQSDVMDAVQRLRAKAKSEGNLETTKEQTVTVAPAPVTVEQKVVVEAAEPAAAPAAAAAPQTIIQIEQADPQVVYVPIYNPTVVYGTWPYPSYPPYSYYPPGYAAGAVITFGVGMAVGAALWGDCNWGGYGHNDIDIDVNRYNEFNRTNINNGDWNHNVEHRKGVQYKDKASQQRYGRGQTQTAQSREAFRGRAESGRQDLAGPGGERARRDVEAQQRQRAGDQRPGAERPQPSQRDAGAQRPGDSRPGQYQERARQPQSRDARPSASGSRSAFGDSSSGRQARDYSNRGQASRQGSFGGGGRSGMGGGRSGGGMRR
jgi:uncharacterized membrane protein YgcG